VVHGSLLFKGFLCVVAFPKLPEDQQVTLKVVRWEERDKTACHQSR
jgi:hypothetical protein